VEEITISSKGQIVIPKYMRDALGLKEGKKVLAVLDKNRLVLIPKPDNPVDELKRKGQELTLRGIRRDIKEE